MASFLREKGGEGARGVFFKHLLAGDILKKYFFQAGCQPKWQQIIVH